MNKFVHYWKQGWKFQLAMLIFNICVALILVPVALFLDLDKQSYYAIAIPVYVLLLVPIGGYLFCWLSPQKQNANDSANA